MSILDMTDNFCKPINEQKDINNINVESLASNKTHEQPLVSFIEKNHEEEVIYREEM